VVLLARWLPCSLLLTGALGQGLHQRAGGQEILKPAERGRDLAAGVVRLGVGPRPGNHPFAAVGQHDQQLRHAVATQPAQHPHPLAIQRVFHPGDRHDGHPRSPLPATE